MQRAAVRLPHAWAVPPVAAGAILALPLLLFARPFQDGLAIVAIMAFGIPHGASDAAFARVHWNARLGRYWLTAYIAIYLALAAMAFAVWQALPAAFLTVFLAVSIWHFGQDDTPHAQDSLRPLETRAEICGRGVLAVTGASVFHAAQLADLLSSLTYSPQTAHVMVQALFPLAVGAAAIVGAIAIRRAGEGDFAMALELAAILFVLLAFPPLPAFALYFCLVHSLRQLTIRRHKLGLSLTQYYRIFMPYIAGGIAIVTAAIFYLPFAGAALIAGLAALNFPHMLMNR